LIETSQSFRATIGSPASFFPYQNPSNVNQALSFTIPGLVNGSSTAVGRSRLWGAESNLTCNFSTTRGAYFFSASVLAGFRYLDLEDRVTVANELDLVNDPVNNVSLSGENAALRTQSLASTMHNSLPLARSTR
jgi:hypothetical protein